MIFLTKYTEYFIKQYNDLINGDIAKDSLFILNIFISNYSGVITNISCEKYIEKGAKINIKHQKQHIKNRKSQKSRKSRKSQKSNIPTKKNKKKEVYNRYKIFTI